MARPSLEGRSILIVEDEPLIVMDITQQFEVTGAALTTTNTLKHALILVEHDGLSGAILDHALPDGDSSELCTRLKGRGIWPENERLPASARSVPDDRMAPSQAKRRPAYLSCTDREHQVV